MQRNTPVATTAEQLILRGLNLVIRASFSPSDPAAQAKHFKGIQDDIGPWFADYVEEIEKPAIDFTLTRFDEPGGSGGLQQ